ncbi:MAG: aldehyde dehydrogenase family protein [Pseudomonas sp.]
MTISRLKSPELFRQQCHIDGRWVDAASGNTLDVHNPANGDLTGRVPLLSAHEVTGAITAAASALRQWRTRTAQERADRLLVWHDLILQNREDLAVLMTLEQGKPLTESRGEIDYAASFIRWFAEEARRMYGETIPGARPGQHILVNRQPVGVCAAITPWNFPAAMIARKAGVNGQLI